MDNPIWVTLAVSIISSGLVGTILTAVVKRIQNGDPSKVALKLLLQDKVTFLMEREIQKGETTTETHKMIYEMYHSYKSLNGNGDVEWLKGKYDSLPIHVSKKTK